MKTGQRIAEDRRQCRGLDFDVSTLWDLSEKNLVGASLGRGVGEWCVTVMLLMLSKKGKWGVQAKYQAFTEVAKDWGEELLILGGCVLKEGRDPSTHLKQEGDGLGFVIHYLKALTSGWDSLAA